MTTRVSGNPYNRQQSTDDLNLKRYNEVINLLNKTYGKDEKISREILHRAEKIARTIYNSNFRLQSLTSICNKHLLLGHHVEAMNIAFTIGDPERKKSMLERINTELAALKQQKSQKLSASETQDKK